MSSLPIQIVERLRRYVRKLRRSEGVDSLLRIWNQSGEAYLFGGAPRDLSFGAIKSLNDLDIVVSGPICLDQLEEIATYLKRTRFGGHRLMVGRYEVDAWELDKSYAFQSGPSASINIRSLLNTVCFSTDAIAVSLKSGRVFSSSSFLASYNARRLDFVVRPTMLEPVVGARIARLALKLDLELTPAVAQYFVECVEAFGVPGLIQAEARWGPRRMLNEIAMEHIRFDIREAVAKALDRVQRL